MFCSTETQMVEVVLLLAVHASGDYYVIVMGAATGRKGLGTAVVEGLKATCTGEWIELSSKRTAFPFWVKMGFQVENQHHRKALDTLNKVKELRAAISEKGSGQGKGKAKKTAISASASSAAAKKGSHVVVIEQEEWDSCLKKWYREEAGLQDQVSMCLSMK